MCACPICPIRRISSRWFALGLIAFWLTVSCELNAQARPSSDPEPTDPISLYRRANQALIQKDYLQAIECFKQVASLTSGSPLALEASYYELIAKRHLLTGDHTSQNLEQLAIDCSHWICNAKAWKQSTPKQQLENYSDKLTQRIASIQTLETQLAFAGQRWLETLALLDQTPVDPNAPEALDIESNLMRIECCIQLQRWSDAEKSTEALQTIAEEYLTQIPPPNWLEKYLLRKAEVTMVLGKWKVAESDVWKIRTHFPECKVSTQVDYVLARCLVNDAKFEEARQLLASVLANEPPPPAPLQTKVWWTMAESHLMQRNYSAALTAYEQVAKLGADSPWATLAQRQMAICQQAHGSSVASGSEPNNNVPMRSTQKQTPKQPR